MVVVGRGMKENIAEQCRAIVMSWECQMGICMVVWKVDFLDISFVAFVKLFYFLWCYDPI